MILYGLIPAGHRRKQPERNPGRTTKNRLEELSFLGDNNRIGSGARRIRTFVRSNGKAPFEEWFLGLKYKTSKARILTRIDRLRFGSFGDCKSVGGGVLELGIPFGPGFRVYFGLAGLEVVLLLGGGDKSTQKKDIRTCQRYWKEYSDGTTEKKKESKKL